MKLRQIVSQKIKSLDFFATNQYLRQNQQSVYSTVTGGICSIILIVILLVMFTNLGIQTVKMQIIVSSKSVIQTNDPPLMKVQLQSANFMLAVGITFINMNDPNIRYFDALFQEIALDPQFNPISVVPTILVQCTTAHFDFDQQVLNHMQQRVNFLELLCPPLGFEFQIKGKFTSANPIQSMISITKCNPANPFDSRPCATEAQILAATKRFYNDITASLFVINPLINPSQQNYLSYYVEDNIYISFLFDKGGYVFLNVQSIEINSDVSLMPFQKIETEKAFFIDKASKETSFAINASNPTLSYATFTLLSSPSTTVYQRSFNKIDNYLSYIGGLVGTILGFLFIFRNYTEMSYEIDTAKHLFSDESSQNNSPSNDQPPTLEASADSFNIFYFFGFKFYELLKWLGCKPKWRQMKIYNKASQELRKQLNVNYLLERVLFLERTIQMILEEHQLNGLHLMKKPTIAEAEKIRLRYQVKRNLSDQKNESKRQQLKGDQMGSINLMTDDQFKDFQNRNKDQAENQSVNDLEIIRQEKKKIKHSIQQLKEAQQYNKLAKRISNNLDPAIIQKFVSPILLLVQNLNANKKDQSSELEPINRQSKKVVQSNVIFLKPYDQRSQNRSK